MKGFAAVAWDRLIDQAYELDREHPYLSQMDEEDEIRALGGPGSGNFGHEGRPGQVGGSAPAGSNTEAVSKVISGLPDKVSDEVSNVTVNARPTQTEASEKIDDYLSKNYGITLGEQARYMVDRDKEYAITSSDPGSIARSLIHSLGHRIDSPEWRSALRDHSDQKREEDFVTAFASLVLSEPMQEVMKMASPVEAIEEIARPIFKKWGWL